MFKMPCGLVDLWSNNFWTKKWCSHFYKLLNFSIKRINLWESTVISLDNSWNQKGFQYCILNPKFE